jgi:hypothetical protein
MTQAVTHTIKFSMVRPISTILMATLIVGLPTLASANSRHHHWRYPHAARMVGAPPCYPAPACLSPYAVFSAGTYIGSDPDPRIRAQLLYDFNRGVNAPSGR